MFNYWGAQATCHWLGGERCLSRFLLCCFALCCPLLLLILHFRTIPLFFFLPLPLLFGSFLWGLIRDRRGGFCSWELCRREVMARTGEGLQYDKQRLFREC